MPRSVKYIRAKNAPCQTLLEYLTLNFKYLTLNEWTCHICSGHVLVNNTTERDIHRILVPKDLITFAPPRSLEPEVDEENISVTYVDDNLIVCSKNGNLPVSEGGRYCENTLVEVLLRCGLSKFYTHTTINKESVLKSEQTRLTNKKRAVEIYNCNDNCFVKTSKSVNCCKNNNDNDENNDCDRCNCNDAGGEQFMNCKSSHKLMLFVVHRLDKETSGLVVIARSAQVARLLAQEFSQQSLLHDNEKNTLNVDNSNRNNLLNENIANVSTTLEENGKNKQEQTLSNNNSSTTAVKLEEHVENRTQKGVRKQYVAILVGCAEIGRKYVVNERIGCMAKDSNVSREAAHVKLKKLKMKCYQFNAESENMECDTTVNEKLKKKNNNITDLKEHTSSNEQQLGKPAKSEIIIINNNTELNLSFAKVIIYTGRTHQIRLHCAHIGFPVFGDKLYYSHYLGKKGFSYAVDDEVYLKRVRATESAKYMSDENVEKLKVCRQLLHAAYIRFAHPITKEQLEFVDSPVGSFQQSVLCDEPQTLQQFANFIEYSYKSCS